MSVSETEPNRPTDPATNLRADLERTRQQAQEEINRLNRKIAARELEAERGIASIAERQAMQQDLTTLQRTLGQKEQVLEKITQECRRLEDELEDQYLAFDGLRQEVERKDRSLKAAWEEAELLRRQLTAIQDSSVDISQAPRVPRPPPPPAPSLPPAEPDSPPASLHHAVMLSTGFLAGVVALAIAALMLWGGVDLNPGQWRDRIATQGAAPDHPDPNSKPSDTPKPQAAPENGTSAAAKADPVVPPAQPQSTPSTVRDQLRDGSPGPTLALLTGGPFRMGYNSLGGSDHGPEHEVQVAPFLIGVHEVTFQQYDRFVRATGRRFPDDFGWGRGTRPVVGVSWADAQAYADWLSRQTGHRYRLPSEAEWEFAARGGGRGSYWWGFGMEPGRAACFDCGTQWDNRSTAPVGSFGPNAYGLHDTAGNVLEWVEDCYSPSHEGAPSDGRARLDGGCDFRVARGGAFNKPSASMRTYARNKLAPETRLNFLGFRVAREP